MFSSTTPDIKDILSEEELRQIEESLSEPSPPIDTSELDELIGPIDFNI